MIIAAVSVAVFCFSMTMRRSRARKPGASCEPRAPSSRQKIMRAIAMHALQKIGKRRETFVAFAAVVVSARAHEGEFGAMKGEFIDLSVIQLDRADELRRRKELETAVAQPAVCREARMRGEPAGDRRRIDGVAMTRGQAAAGFFEGIAAIICRKRIKDFVERIGFVAQSARAGSEGAAARLAAIQPDCFELLGAAALGRDAPAVAGRTALGRLDERSGFAADCSVVRGMRGL